MSRSNQNNQAGFTLAEVLVTLAVIGIVAALTIPTLTKAFQERQWKTAYRKAYSDISRAVVMGLADNAWTPRTTTTDVSVATTNFNLLQQYFGIAKTCLTGNNSECWEINGEKANLTLPGDNSKAFIDRSGYAWSQYYLSENILLVDVNGFKAPNKYGQDRWAFTYTDRDNNRIGSGGTAKTLPEKVRPYIFSDITTYNANWCQTPPCYYKSWLTE